MCLGVKFYLVCVNVGTDKSNVQGRLLVNNVGMSPQIYIVLVESRAVELLSSFRLLMYVR